jgi:hypothetical protein
MTSADVTMIAAKISSQSSAARPVGRRRVATSPGAAPVLFDRLLTGPPGR